MKDKKQPWIYGAGLDGIFILSPPFISIAIVFLFPDVFMEAEVSLLSWIVLVLFIDVAHVYTTLYRTYFDTDTFERHKKILVYIPLIAWIAGVMAYEISPVLFWRMIAYLAVFHFIRQQYGFMRIYSRKNNVPVLFRYIDNFTVYYAALYPVLFWHTHAPRNFHWFIEGDFIYFHSQWFSEVASFVYKSAIAVYILKELYGLIRYRSFNFPRNAVIAGTFLSWYFGIVYFNGDLVFTMLNVVSHGIPYMALVWIYGAKKYAHGSSDHSVKKKKLLFTGYGVLFFLGIVFLLAYLEEGLWDGLVWNEHQTIFPGFSLLPRFTDKDLLALLVPLLSLPQLSHYLIDGFIWKISRDDFNWKKVTLENRE